MRLPVGRIVLVLAALLGHATAASAQRMVIRAGRLLDPATGLVARDQTIIVEDGRISAVGASLRSSPRDSVVDLSRYTVLPGLFDAHVHLVIGGPMRATALADLRAGFTTIVDLGARTTGVLAFRDSINAGLVPGPRVLAAGIWIGRRNGVCEFGGIGIAGGAEGFRQRVRENVEAGADVIKACVSGWAPDAYAEPDAYELPDSVLLSIVDEARRLRRAVIAHDISLGGVRAAVRAGVRGLAHAAYLDDGTAGLLRDREIFLIPTLASLVGADSSTGARALVAATVLAHRTGVPLVFGTDAGVLPHGQGAEEFVALARAGIPLLDAIRAATTGAARALGVADSLGAVAPGFLADIIAVDGDPLTDASALGRVRFVMVRGRVVEGRKDGRTVGR
jgi:imidazolonepropionase-like amidohydrolase